MADTPGTTFARSNSLLAGAPPLQRRQDWFLVYCRTVNLITAICLLLCAAAFAMAIVLRGNGEKGAYTISGQVVRVFGIGLAAMGLFVESEWRFVIKLAPLMEIWIARGLYYLFIAALTFREAYPNEEMTDFQKSLQLYRTVASLALAGCALVYGTGGLCCMGARRKKREEAESEYEELERRRRELQRLLGVPAEP